MKDINKKQNNFDENENKKIELSLNNLNKSPRLEDIKIEDDKFFAYEKQKAHN